MDNSSWLVFLCFVFGLVSSQSPEYRPAGSFSKCVQNGHLALTFDDGPSEYTDGFLDVLKNHEVNATFFIQGNRVNSIERSATLTRMKKDGHTLASHTWSHRELLLLSPSEIEEEMTRTAYLIYSATGLMPALMRPPYGSITDEIYTQLREMGYQVIIWNLDTKDWYVSRFQPNLLYEDYYKYFHSATPAESSWIALHHDIYAETLRYLPDIIAFVRDSGYQIVDIKTCLGVETVYQNLQETENDL